MKQEHRHHIRARTNLLIDIAAFIAFLIATAPRFSGIAIHEWLSVAFAVAIIVHMLLHWQWIIALSKTMLRKARMQVRLGYILNLALFIDVTLLTFTGLMISQVALPLFGIRPAPSSLWRGLHSLTSNLGVLMVGLHLALHWQWTLKTTARLFGFRMPKSATQQEVS